MNDLTVLVLGDSRSYHLERYVAELRRQGCRVVTASLEDGQVCDHRLKRRGWFSWLHYSLCAREINRLVRRLKPDIINPHFASGYGFSVALARFRGRIPTVLHLWGSDILIVPYKSALHRRKTAFALSDADLVVADSAYLLEQARSLAPIRRAEIIPWGIERDYLKLHRRDYRLGRPLRIIVPRRHERIYNNIFVLRSLAPLAEAGLVELTFPAYGSLFEDFRRMADSMTEHGIKYYENRPRGEFLALMAEHDVYLSSALSDSSPASLIEAMGLGLIPIAPDIPGVREWLTAESGYRYEPYAAESLRALVKRIIERDDPHEEMRRRNLERVERTAVFENNLARIVTLMRSLVERATVT